MTSTANIAAFRVTTLDVFVASTMVLARLWVALVAIPAGLFLSVLLVANDFSVAKVVESFVVFSQESVQSLQPGTVAGTYRWTECIGAKRPRQHFPQSPLATDQCKERAAREGSLSEALAPGVAFICNFYGFISLFIFIVMLTVWTRSNYALRSTLARLLRLNRS